MKSTVKKLAGGAATVASVLAISAVNASGVSAQAAAPASQTFQANLVQQNKSGASGSATVTLTGNNVTVRIRATGMTADQAHAQHLHVGGQGVCAPATADTDKDGFIGNREAESSVGAIRVALTTSGDIAPGSALAVDRMPKADARGNLSYDRTFALPAGVTAADMSRATIDLHGVGSLFDDKARYDGAKRSDLDNKLPFETTAIASCGKLASAPTGTLATGAGGTAGLESPAILAMGTAALVSAAAVVLYSRRMADATRL
jgi:hypothetical protein